MSTTNENILNSLAVLEQNLKDINSAKEQVNSVVISSVDLAKVIESYNTTFESLSINVKAVLEDSRKFNNDSIKKLSEQTTNFSKEIAKLTEFDVSKSLKSIESETIKHFQQNLSKPLEDLNKQITNIENEVSKLTDFDFKNTFSILEQQVVSQFKIDLKEKLDELDSKIVDIQTKLDEFKEQIERLEQIDLNRHFNELQKVLAEIFVAINGVNLTLTNLLQTISGIVQTLVNIQATLDRNHNETNLVIKDFRDATYRKLTNFERVISGKMDLIENKIKSLSEENAELKNAIKTNRVIQVVGFFIIVVVLVILKMR